MPGATFGFPFPPPFPAGNAGPRAAVAMGVVLEGIIEVFGNTGETTRTREFAVAAPPGPAPTEPRLRDAPLPLPLPLGDIVETIPIMPVFVPTPSSIKAGDPLAAPLAPLPAPPREPLPLPPLP